MEIAGNSNAETSTAFLRQLREKHPGPLVVIWDSTGFSPPRGAAIRQLFDHPWACSSWWPYRPTAQTSNADEAVWEL